MPSPTSRRKSVPQPPTAVDIANSNRTMDTLLGRPRHSWMTNSALPPSIPGATRPRTERRMTDQSKPSQLSTDRATRPGQGHRTQSHGGAKQTLPASGPEVSSVLATLPSPQSTIQSPETLTSSTSPHNPTASTSPSSTQAATSTPQLAEPSSKTAPQVNEADQAQVTVSTSADSAITISTAATSRPSTISAIAAATSARTLAQDTNADSVTLEGVARALPAGFGNDSAPLETESSRTTIPPSNKRPAETQGGNDVAQSQGPAKRLRTDHAGQQFELTLNQCSRMEQACGGRANLNRIEMDRFAMVREALTAENKDLFILLLLQTYSQWSLSRSSDVYDYLDLPQDVVDLSFKMLANVVGPHTNMRQTLQEYFANLLGDLRILGGHRWVHAYDQLRHFLRRFGKVWASELESTVNRGRPFMVSELRDDLLCPSDRLQRNLFAYSGRALQKLLRQQTGEASNSTQTSWDKDLESKMEMLLRESQATERRWNGTNTSLRDREAGRAKIEENIRTLLSTRLAPAPPTLTPTATENQRSTQSQSLINVPPVGSGIQSPAITFSPVSGPTSQQSGAIAANNFYQSLPSQLQHTQGQHAAFIPQTTNQMQHSQQPQNVYDQQFASQQQQQHARGTVQSYGQHRSSVPRGSQLAVQHLPGVQHSYQAQTRAEAHPNAMQAQHSQLFQAQSLLPLGNVLGDSFAEDGTNGSNSVPQSGDHSRLRAQNSIAPVQTPQQPIPNFNFPLPSNIAHPAGMRQPGRIPATSAYDQRRTQTAQAGQSNPSTRWGHPLILNNEPPQTAPRRNIGVIHPTEYPHDSDDWTSLRAGLHLATVRSPPRRTVEPTNLHQSSERRFHQFIGGYLAPPRVVRPHYGMVTVNFDFSEEQLSRIPVVVSQKDRLVCVHTNNTIRARFRLCKVPKPVDQEFAESVAVVSPTVWPKTVFFTMNGNTVFLKRKQHFRWDLPAEITGGLRAGENKLQMSFPEHQNEAVPYWLTIESVTTASESVLRETIEARAHFLADETRDKIRQQLKVSDDDDLVVTDNTLTISLTDPFSSIMCKVPVRSAHCQHLQCFDLDNWLSSRPTKFPHAKGEPTKIDEWKCPICATDARPSQLRVDDYFREIIAKLQADGKGRTRQIVVDEKADWVAVEEPDDSEDDDESGPAEQNGRVGSRSSSRPAPAVIVLDDSD